MNSEIQQHPHLFIDKLLHNRFSPFPVYSWSFILPKVHPQLLDLSLINDPLALSFKTFQRLLFHQLHRHTDPEF